LDGFFDYFVTVDGTCRRFKGGTGLGLAIPKRYAKAIGAQLSVESTEGKGSTFALTGTFRVLEAKKPKPRGITSELVSSKKILVVEENQINGQIIEAMLKNWGTPSRWQKMVSKVWLWPADDDLI